MKERMNHLAFGHIMALAGAVVLAGFGILVVGLVQAIQTGQYLGAGVLAAAILLLLSLFAALVIEGRTR